MAKKKIDFRKVIVKDLYGRETVYDVSEKLGNYGYMEAPDIPLHEFSSELFHKGEVDVDARRAAFLKQVLDAYFVAVIRIALDPVLDGIVEEDRREREKAVLEAEKKKRTGE